MNVSRGNTLATPECGKVPHSLMLCLRKSSLKDWFVIIDVVFINEVVVDTKHFDVALDAKSWNSMRNLKKKNIVSPAEFPLFAVCFLSLFKIDFSFRKVVLFVVLYALILKSNSKFLVVAIKL
jgi:hypothetical protein